MMPKYSFDILSSVNWVFLHSSLQSGFLQYVCDCVPLQTLPGSPKWLADALVTEPASPFNRVDWWHLLSLLQIRSNIMNSRFDAARHRRLLGGQDWSVVEPGRYLRDWPYKFVFLPSSRSISTQFERKSELPNIHFLCHYESVHTAFQTLFCFLRTTENKLGVKIKRAQSSILLICIVNTLLLINSRFTLSYCLRP